jgi:hypothetical protein
MNNELEMMWNEEVLAYFEVLTEHLLQDTAKP